MLRLTCFPASLSKRRAKPAKKGWCYQWSLIPDNSCTEDIDDSEEYVQEWDFPYPGQKKRLMIGWNTLVSPRFSFSRRGTLQTGQLDYLRQERRFDLVQNPKYLVSLKK